jgi:hypothetical protein
VALRETQSQLARQDEPHAQLAAALKLALAELSRD